MGVRNEWVGRRQAMRQTCQMRAELRFTDGRLPIECTIIDISAVGARLTLPDGFDCPEDFDLYIPSRDETKQAKVRRVTDDGVAVAFVKARQQDSQTVQSINERLARLETAFADVKRLAPLHAVDADASILPALDARVDALAAGLAELRSLFDMRAAPPEPVNHAPEIASLRDDLSALNGRLQEMSAAAEQPVKELAEDIAKDFTGIRAEMSRLDTSVRALTEMASVNAALTPNDHGPEIISLRGEVAALAQAVRDVTDGDALPSSPPANDLSDIRAEMEKLGVSMRGNAQIPRPEDVRPVQPTPAVHLPSEADVAEMKAEIAELRAIVAKMAAAEPAAPQEGAETLRGEVDELRQSVRALILVVAKSLNAPRQAA
ncbi:MAG TPA: PilZ domain-containing protein [Beijerinckiaceae bacterium]|jgi:hypothetical protein|nr:PilZ domain-containing protein [Beijerinckiaceae bacterium]